MHYASPKQQEIHVLINLRWHERGNEIQILTLLLSLCRNLKICKLTIRIFARKVYNFFRKTTKFMTVVKPQQLEFLYLGKKQKCHFCNIKLCKCLNWTRQHFVRPSNSILANLFRFIWKWPALYPPKPSLFET